MVEFATKDSLPTAQPSDYQTSLLATLIDAVRRNPDQVFLLQSIGKILAEQGMAKQALKYFLRASAADPTCVEALYNCGVAYMAVEKDERAEAWFHRALAVDPSYARAELELGRIYFRRQEVEKALAQFTAVLLQDPNNGIARNNVGAVHWREGDIDAAMDCFEEALNGSPRDAGLLSNLSAAYMERHWMGKADDTVLRALEVRPGSAELHFLRSHGLLLDGRWLEGWQDYEWRFQLRRLHTEVFRHIPHWKGESIAGRTLLVVAEQGFGDSILCLRYLPALHEAGAKLKLKVQDRLVPLVQHTMPFIEIVAQDDYMPQADYFVHTMSLPHRFQTTCKSVPRREGYLEIRKQRRTAAATASRKTNIGLCWSCSDLSGTLLRRSTSLERFQSHFRNIGDAKFYSLQHGSATSALKEEQYSSWIDDLCSADRDFMETARKIDEMDLVITVDTAVAHLAGAMGKPTWILLPHVADWRWLRDTNTTPWYDSVILRRQPAMNDWDSLLATTALELGEYVKHTRNLQ